MAEPELEQITYLRQKKAPSLAQFLVRKAIAQAAAGARGATGKVTVGGRLMPASALRIKQDLPDLKDTEALAAEHPEWVREYEEKYGQG